MVAGDMTDAAVRRPGLAFTIFCLYTFILIARPQDFVPYLTPLRLALLFTVLTAVFTVFSSRVKVAGFFRSKESKLYFLFCAILCATVPFSVFRHISFNYIILVYLVNMIFFSLFVIHVNTFDKYRRIVAVLAISAFAFSLSGLLLGRIRGGRFVRSEVYDPKDVACVALALLPIGLYVVFGPYKLVMKVLAFSGAMLSTLLTLFTGSRGGMIGLLILFLMFLLLPLPRVTRTHKGTLFVLLAFVAMVKADKINLQRYMTMGNLEQDYNMYDGTGRTQIWKRGTRLFLENPIFGVGVNCSPEAIGVMCNKENLLEQWQVIHNSYLQVLTETGVKPISSCKSSEA